MPGLFAQCIGRLSIRRHAQALPGTLDPLLEKPLLGLIELFLPRFGFSQEAQGTVILLVFQVIQPIPHQIAGPAVDGNRR
jgi:hypothetical protein